MSHTMKVQSIEEGRCRLPEPREAYRLASARALPGGELEVRFEYSMVKHWKLVTHELAGSVFPPRRYYLWVDCPQDQTDANLDKLRMLVRDSAYSIERIKPREAGFRVTLRLSAWMHITRLLLSRSARPPSFHP